jgi:membrane-associated protease RseP (regulator of RpoE activity)
LEVVLGERMNGYELALIAFLAYLVVVAVGRKAKIWKRHDVTFYGPVLLLKTRRGKTAIKRLASHGRFFSAYGTASTVITLAAMFALTGLIVWEVFVTANGLPAMGVEPPSLPAPSEAGIVSIAVFFLIGLGIAVLVHEFMHGVSSEVGKMRIESMGILLLLVPIGAFVETNDSDLKSAKRMKRLRLYSSGPATNIIVGLALAALLVGILGPSVSPVSEGAAVVVVASGSPADVSGIQPWSLVTGVAGRQVYDSTDFSSTVFGSPGELTSINLTLGGREIMIALPGGIAVTSVSDGPAFNAGIAPGMIIASLNDTMIHSKAELTSVIENSTRTEPVNITVLSYNHDKTAGVSWFVRDDSITNITLTSKWIYYYTHYPSQNREAYRNVSFMGASFGPLGIVTGDPEDLIKPVTQPLAGADGPGGAARAAVNYMALPYLGALPLGPPASDLYGPSGALAFIPHDIYWTIFNIVYWTFWANLMLGLTNALPAMPMDGAFVLRDSLGWLAKKAGDRLTGFDLLIGRRPISDKSVDRLMIGITVVVLTMVAYLIVWQVHGPFQL